MIDTFMNIYLPRLFNWVIETSIMASILVGLILFVKTLLRNKLTPRWHYLLWIILMVRMIVPWSPFSWYSFYSILPYENKATVSVQSQNAISSKNEQMNEMLNTSSTKLVTEEKNYDASTLQITKDNNNKPAISAEKKIDKPISIYTISLYTWLLGILIFGLTTYLVNKKLIHHVKQQPVISDTRIKKIFENCKISMSVKKKIPLLLAGKISSPTVLGFFHPRILLSEVYMNQLTDQKLQHIFYHELAHIKRRDVGINWVMYFLLILNWFNPAIWWAYYCMREDQELACDAYALTYMKEEEKLSYGHTIISLLEHYSHYYQVPNLANLSKNKRVLKRRIMMIKKFQKKSYRWSALGITTLIVVLSISLLNAHAEDSNKRQEEQNKSNVATQDKKKETEKSTLYTPPVQKESYKDLTKDEVLTKLLNTVDYFQTASGKFETFNVYYDNSTSKVECEYTISNKNLIGGYEKIINIPDEKVAGAKITTHEIFYDDQKYWMIDTDKKNFITTYYQFDSSKKNVKPENVFSISLNKIYDSRDQFRESSPVGTSGLSLSPYETTAKYLRFTNIWNIEKQNEKLLGHNTIVLYGSIDKSNLNYMQPQASSFRFWVDKDSGILLKQEVYNSRGEIISYLHPESLSVNVSMDSAQFNPSLDGYNELQIPRPSYKDAREKDIEVIDGADSIIEEVKAVEAKLRTNIPWLYEFSDPELQVFSASMERYKEFNHAYLVYSYKKPANELGSGSRLLYVRTYHKDSVVSSTGDFDREKGEKLDSFTLNGIEWNAYEEKNTPNVHFIGSSENYVYEVVTQEISFEEAKKLLESFKKSESKQ